MDDKPETPDEVEADEEVQAGRPRGRDELDPELVSLAKRRGTAGPLLSISIIVFCVYIMVRLSADLRFSRQADTPTTLDGVAEVVAGKGVGPDDFIALRATPDQSFVVHLAGTGSRYGHRVAPFVGSDSQLWLLEESTPWAMKPSYSNAYAGRLRRIDDLPFDDNLRDYVASRPAAHRFATTESTREALDEKQSTIVGAFGDTLAVTADTPVAIAVTLLDRARIEAFRKSLPEEEACRSALVAAGVLTGTEQPLATSKEMFVYEIPAPAGLAAVRQKLFAAKLFSARAEPVVRSHDTTWGQLAASSEGLVIAGTDTVPWAHVSSVSLLTTRSLPSNAMVLLTNERPGNYWYMLPLFVLLGVFVLLFVWALFQYFRRDAGVGEPAPAEKPST